MDILNVCCFTDFHHVRFSLIGIKRISVIVFSDANLTKAAFLWENPEPDW